MSLRPRPAVTALLLTAAAVGSALALQATGVRAAPTPPLTSVAAYRTWTRVNPKPHQVFSAIALLCRPATPVESAKLQTDPHQDKWMTVYVNAVGKGAMLRQKKPRFPQGSIIVKAKHPSEASSEAELLTVMRKREKGYNPDNGDWEYLTFDGAGRKVLTSGQLSRCQSCHEEWKATDYVSRHVLPDHLRAALR